MTNVTVDHIHTGGPPWISDHYNYNEYKFYKIHRWIGILYHTTHLS
jgi:hypothetical protein